MAGTLAATIGTALAVVAFGAGTASATKTEPPSNTEYVCDAHVSLDTDDSECGATTSTIGDDENVTASTDDDKATTTLVRENTTTSVAPTTTSAAATTTTAVVATATTVAQDLGLPITGSNDIALIGGSGALLVAVGGAMRRLQRRI